MSILRQAVILIPTALILKIITKSDDAIWWAYPISETGCCLIFIFVTSYTIKNLFIDKKEKIKAI